MAVSRLGIFLAESVKPEYGGIFSAVVQYGGNALVLGGFPFFGGNDFGGRRYYQIMAVNCYITGTAHQGGNCLLYTSPSPRDQRGSRMPSSA